MCIKVGTKDRETNKKRQPELAVLCAAGHLKPTDNYVVWTLFPGFCGQESNNVI